MVWKHLTTGAPVIAINDDKNWVIIETFPYVICTPILNSLKMIQFLSSSTSSVIYWVSSYNCHFLIHHILLSWWLYLVLSVSPSMSIYCSIVFFEHSISYAEYIYKYVHIYIGSVNLCTSLSYCKFNLSLLFFFPIFFSTQIVLSMLLLSLIDKSGKNKFHVVSCITIICIIPIIFQNIFGYTRRS